MRSRLVLTLLLFGGPVAAQSPQESVIRVWVHDVPGPPQGDFRHPVAEHLLSAFTDPASGARLAQEQGLRDRAVARAEGLLR